MLPSELMLRANTFDLAVMDAAIAYQNWQHECARLGHEPVKEPTVEDMQTMLARVKQRKAGDA